MSHFFDSSKELTLNNPIYLKAVEHYVWGAYKMDVEKEDVSTRFFVTQKNKMAKALITARDHGVLAGMQEAKWFLEKLGIKILKALNDGEEIREGDPILELYGPAIKIFPAERTLITLLRRMSGIATMSRRWASKLPRGIRLTTTRHTFWGLLDKRAAALGGALSHRLNLADAVIIKESHLKLKDNWEPNLINVFRRAKDFRFLEIKLSDENQIKRMLPLCQKIHKRYSFQKRVVVLLNDLTPKEVAHWAPIFRGEGIYVEVTGRLTEKNIMDYAIPEVNSILAPPITTHPTPLSIHFGIKKA